MGRSKKNTDFKKLLIKRIQLVSVFFLTLVLSANSVLIHAENEKQINIIVDGLVQKVYPRPVNINGTMFMEAKNLFNAIGLTNYTIDTNKGYVSFNYWRDYVYLEPGNQFAKVNSADRELPVAPQLIDGYIYLPLRYIAVNFCGKTVSWKAETNSVIIDTGKKAHSVIDYITKNIDYDDYEQMELSKAVSSVVKSGNEIVKLNKAISDAQEVVDEKKPIYDSIKKYTFINPYEIIDQRRALQTQYDIISKSEINKKLLVKNTEYSIMSKANSIENLKYEIMLLEKKIELDETNIKNMELKQSLGYETEVNIKAAKDNLELSKINLKNLKINLSNSKMELNKTVNMQLDKNIEITYEKDTKELVVEDIDKYIKEKTEKDMNIELKNIDFKKEKLIRDTHYSVVNTAQRERNDTEKDLDVDAAYTNAEVALNDAKADLDFNIRKVYNSLLLLNEQYKSAEIELLKAVDAYKVKSLLYEVGSATIYEVQQAELAILNAEVSIEQNRLSYALAKYTFENTEFLK